MSQATVRHLSNGTVRQGLDGLLTDLPGLVNTATTQYVDLLRRGLKLAGDIVPSSLTSSLTDLATSGNDCCTVPTQDCPPRCVAEIDWEACGGEPQRAVINVRNTSKQARDFSFAAGSIGPAKVEVQPAGSLLSPGEAVAVHVTVPSTDGLKAGEIYTGELLIRGAYEQCVKLRLRLASPVTATLDVSQGELPQHITELKWYRHWQCVDSCAPSIRGNQPVPGTREPQQPQVG
ncbi:hypothetical protein [Roseateles sp.]|uniref:hypothetical protein n=1 Tax=Roseateles sp. TaxID=1971397 RepID=UPI0039E968DD